MSVKRESRGASRDEGLGGCYRARETDEREEGEMRAGEWGRLSGFSDPNFLPLFLTYFGGKYIILSNHNFPPTFPPHFFSIHFSLLQT